MRSLWTWAILDVLAKGMAYAAIVFFLTLVIAALLGLA